MNGILGENIKGLLPVHGNKLHTTIQYIGKKREIWHSVCEKFQYSFPENLSILMKPTAIAYIPEKIITLIVEIAHQSDLNDKIDSNYFD